MSDETMWEGLHPIKQAILESAYDKHYISLSDLMYIDAANSLAESGYLTPVRIMFTGKKHFRITQDGALLVITNKSGGA